MDAGKQGQREEQKAEFGFHNQSEFSFPYFDDKPIYSAVLRLGQGKGNWEVASGDKTRPRQRRAGIHQHAEHGHE
jgi:hypothetical protein